MKHTRPTNVCRETLNTSVTMTRTGFCVAADREPLSSWQPRARQLRNVLSMLFLGFVVAVLAAVMMTFATRQLSRVNEGHYLPVVIGRFAVRSPSTSTALRVGAQTTALVATLIVLNATWDYTAPWPSLILAVTTLVAPVAIPVIVITLAHNRRLPVPGR